MSEIKNRKWILEQLLTKQKKKQVVEYGVLFDQCIDALGAGTYIISEEKSEEIYDCLQRLYPFSPYSRVDWGKVSSKKMMENVNVIVPCITEVYGQVEDFIFILWSYGNFPVLKTSLQKTINAIDDVLAVSSDTFILSPSKFVIEFHHEGEITVGFENQTL